MSLEREDSPSIGGCSESNSQGWNVKTAGQPASRNAISARRTRSGENIRKGQLPPSGIVRAKPRPVKGGISTKEPPSRETRYGPAGLSERPRGGTGVIDASHWNPSDTRTSSAGSAG